MTANATTARDLVAPRASLLSPSTDVELDVVITLQDGNQPAVAFHSFAANRCDLAWWATMDQSKVLPLTISAHDTIRADGRVRTLGAVAVSLTGTASLYDPSTNTWKPNVVVPAMRSTTGTLVWDPRPLATAEFPWVGGVALEVTASAVYGVGLNRQHARTRVSVSGFIGYIN